MMDASPAAQPPGPGTQPSGSHLLVVDDNPENRDVLTRRLRRLGHTRIENAVDGVDALERIVRHAEAGTPFDAVLLDVMMPRMNGVELLERLAADRRLAETPVIMISASSDVDVVVRCIELGAEDYLPKPFNPVLLRARLGAVLEKKRLRDALARQRLRLEAELSEARQQQLSMVPHEFPAIDPSRPVRVHAVMIPAREVGGDLYDCFEIMPGRLCLAIGDVSGKGMPAALFMARSRSLLRASTLQFASAGSAPSPSQVVGVLNDELCKNNPLGMFVTMVVAFFDTERGRLDYVNAGHVRPFRLDAAHGVHEMVTRPEPPLGVLPGLRYTDHTADLAHDEAWVVISDGLTDMTNAAGQLYGAARIVADLEQLIGAAPEKITAALTDRVHGFAEGTEADDDITVLALCRF